MCCDGGMHFGVDSVPEEWERICHEATARRAQLPLLQICRKQLSDVFGRAEIVTPKYHSLAKTVSQLQVQTIFRFIFLFHIKRKISGRQVGCCEAREKFY